MSGLSLSALVEYVWCNFSATDGSWYEEPGKFTRLKGISSVTVLQNELSNHLFLQAFLACRTSILLVTVPIVLLHVIMNLVVEPCVNLMNV